MFQIFAARMFEQRVLHAYKQSVAEQVKAGKTQTKKDMGEAEDLAEIRQALKDME